MNYNELLQQYISAKEDDWYSIEITMEELEKLMDVLDQAECLVDHAKRIRGKSIDDGDHWEVNEIYFEALHKSIKDIKNG